MNVRLFGTRMAGLASAMRVLARLTAEERAALRHIATWAANENFGARREGKIHGEAVISPLASLRFAERVEIGARANIGPFCCIWGGWSHTWARVGEGALLSPGVVLVAGNHVTAGEGPVRDLGFEELDVEVGPGAWVGAHAVVIGCRVGAGAVVGANSVVTEDVPERAIAVGSPARVVGYRADG